MQRYYIENNQLIHINNNQINPRDELLYKKFRVVNKEEHRDRVCDENEYWRNKIAPTTVNLAAGETVTEIEVFEIKLTSQMQPEPVLRQIDKAIKK